MSTSKDRYHHGDLRNTLLDAAEAMVDANIARTFSLRELARTAGVSHAAPYKHFTDHEELVAALAERWMAEFVASQESAARGLNPREDLLDVGEAYVQWALAHPNRFTVIFDPANNRGPGDAGLSRHARHHADLLGRLVTDAIAVGTLHGPEGPEGTRLWATVHGLATLVLLGHIPAMSVRPALEQSLVPTSGPAA